MLEKVQEAVGGESMKSLHDKLKKMQVRALLLHFIRILPRRSGRRQRATNEGSRHDTLHVLADESCGQGERARRQERTAGRPHGRTGAAGQRNEEARGEAAKARQSETDLSKYTSKAKETEEQTGRKEEQFEDLKRQMKELSLPYFV